MAPRRIKQFRPKSHRARQMIELWDAWVGCPVQEIPGHGYFISEEGMHEFDTFLTNMVRTVARIPENEDF